MMRRAVFAMYSLFSIAFNQHTVLCQTDSLAEFLPLAVGNAWTYYYTTYLDERMLTTEYYDSGYATYRVAGAVVTEDSTVWSIVETSEVQHRRRFYFPPLQDTTYSVRDTTTFELVELHEGLHPVYRNSTSDDWKPVFPSIWSYGIVRVFRYGAGDTAKYDTLIISHQEYYRDNLYTFVLRKGRGIVSLSSSTSYSAFWRATNHLLDNYRITSVPGRHTSRLPGRHQLQQNYPNPFNPSTTMEFALPHAGYVTLKVFNVLGEEVANLIKGDHAAGTFKATWDASNMPSGVYFYRLNAGEYVQTRKAILMK
jgi:hypothetical protein